MSTKRAPRIILTLLAAVAAAALVTSASAQIQTPIAGIKDPIRFLIGYAPGGGSDRAARMLGQALTAKHGAPVIVENKPGAGGRIAAQQLKRATRDETVLMLANPAVITVAPIVYSDNQYDPETDFVPVSEIMAYEFAVAVGPQVPASSVTQLLEWMKSNPTKAFFGVPATGSLPHFFALMLGDRSGTKVEVVGYKGSAPLTTDLIGGQISIAVDTLDSLLPLHKAGKLKILAVSGQKRSEFAADLPTLKEAGIDVAAIGWNTFFAARSMPKERIEALAAAIAAAMADPALQKQFRDANMEPVSATQVQTSAMLDAYKAQWQPIISRSGYRE